MHDIIKLTADRKAKFDWNREMQKAFEILKDRFITALVLAYFDPEKETIMETNASDFANGAVLYQRGKDGQLHPVAFFSAKHSAQKYNYDIYNKEFFAIIKTLEEWQPKLEGLGYFDIISDYKNLTMFIITKRFINR